MSSVVDYLPIKNQEKKRQFKEQITFKIKKGSSKSNFNMMMKLMNPTTLMATISESSTHATNFFPKYNLIEKREKEKRKIRSRGRKKKQILYFKPMQSRNV